MLQLFVFVLLQTHITPFSILSVRGKLSTQRRRLLRPHFISSVLTGFGEDHTGIVLPTHSPTGPNLDTRHLGGSKLQTVGGWMGVIGWRRMESSWVRGPRTCVTAGDRA